MDVSECRVMSRSITSALPASEILGRGPFRRRIVRGVKRTYRNLGSSWRVFETMTWPRLKWRQCTSARSRTLAKASAERPSPLVPGENEGVIMSKDLDFGILTFDRTPSVVGYIHSPRPHAPAPNPRSSLSLRLTPLLTPRLDFLD